MKPFIVKNLFEKDNKKPYEIPISRNSFGKFVQLSNMETEAEKHKKWTDVYIVLDGEADLTVGEDLLNSKEIEDGEFRGGEITKPITTKLRKGSIAIITHNFPHKLKTYDVFAQLVIKIKDN
ncbi:hypothetical protein [Petrotoga sibirica]|uniref:Cupin 2 conserved barrel domain-containing protein n=2 Tax=Petrotoga sibirica TaxID=156202 RepID=A0A4R8EXL5_9BACT|nr:hypothetical protein [Petrotoga sibirica]POZ88720.1 hypothetical protein AA80_03755 [Petrotoga sibirica DSM 13575]TDX17319.1 hypothetical protein C8D74_10136 [Petrotoga sibirica]